MHSRSRRSSADLSGGETNNHRLFPRRSTGRTRGDLPNNAGPNDRVVGGTGALDESEPIYSNRTIILTVEVNIIFKTLATDRTPFSGNLAEWESFHDRFTALIIRNKDLSDFSRMHFLTTSLTGSARKVISSISITADNFSVAWKALKVRFENKKRLIDLHIAALYNLPPMARESAVELHSLRDTTDKSISALKSLGRSSEEILSDILVYFVVQKLDSFTRRA